MKLVIRRLVPFIVPVALLSIGGLIFELNGFFLGGYLAGFVAGAVGAGIMAIQMLEG